MKPVEAGLGDQLLGAVGNVLNNFLKKGIDLGKAAEKEGVYKIPMKLKTGDTFTLEYKYYDDSNKTMKFLIKDNEGHDMRARNVPTSKFMTKVMELLEEGWGLSPEDILGDSSEDNEEDEYYPTTSEDHMLNASKHMKVTLQKVNCGQEAEIQLQKVYGNFSIPEMDSTLDIVLNDANLLESLSDEPISLSIVDDGSDLDVEYLTDATDAFLTDSSDCIYESFVRILSHMHCAYDNFKTIHWNAKGDRFDDIHQAADKASYLVQSYIDIYGELCVQLCGKVPNLGYVECLDCDLLQGEQGFSGDEGLVAVKDQLTKLSQTVNFYYCNFEAYIQDSMLDLIRELDAQADYFVARSLESMN